MLCVSQKRRQEVAVERECEERHIRECIEAGREFFRRTGRIECLNRIDNPTPSFTDKFLNAITLLIDYSIKFMWIVAFGLLAVSVIMFVVDMLSC